MYTCSASVYKYATMFKWNQYCDDGEEQTLTMTLEDAFNFVKQKKSLFELIADPCRVYIDLDLPVDEKKAVEMDKKIRPCIQTTVWSLFEKSDYTLVTSHGMKKGKYSLSYHIYVPQYAESKKYILNKIVPRFDEEMASNWSVAGNEPFKLSADFNCYHSGIQKFRAVGSRKAFKNEEKDDAKCPRWCLITDRQGKTTPIEETEFEDWAETIASNIEGLPKVGDEFDETEEKKFNKIMCEFFGVEQSKSNGQNQYPDDDITVETLQRIVDGIDATRFGNHDPWVSMLLAIKATQIQYNLDQNECINVADSISSRAPKYKGKRDVELKYISLAPKGLITIGSLLGWLKEDNLREFKAYQREKMEKRRELEDAEQAEQVVEDAGNVFDANDFDEKFEASELESTTQENTTDDESEHKTESNSARLKREAREKKIELERLNKEIKDADEEEKRKKEEEKKKNQQSKAQQKKNEEEQKKIKKTNKMTILEQKAAMKLHWSASDQENCIDFTKDEYTWDSFRHNLVRMFQSELELEQFIMEHSRRCIVRVDGGFYVKKSNNENIYDFIPAGKLADVDLIFKGMENRKPKLSQYVDSCFRYCSIVTCIPSEKVAPNILNTWGKIEAKRVQVDMSKVQPWLDFIRKIWAREDEAVFKWLLRWFQITCTMSPKKTNKAIFVFGTRGGEGKSLLANFIKMILGPKMTAENNGLSQMLEKHENAVEGKKFVIVNEIQEGREDMAAHFNQLKTYITDTDIRVNPKNKEQRNVKNYSNLLLISNHEDAIFMHPRRYMVIEIDNHYAQPANQKAARLFATQNLTMEAADHFYSYLMELDLADVDIEEIPNTDARNRAIERCKNFIELFVEVVEEDFKESKAKFEVCDDEPTDEKNYWVTAAHLHRHYEQFCEKNKIKQVHGLIGFQHKIGRYVSSKKIEKRLSYNMATLSSKK